MSVILGQPLGVDEAPLLFGPSSDGSITLAFYKGRGTLFDRLIRAVTRSAYSHVELIACAPPEPAAQVFSASSVSASPRDGGVRQKQITFEPGHWDYIELPAWPFASTNMILSRARQRIGFGYDYAGILFTFAIPLRREASGRYFCSELIGEVLDLPDPHTLAPGDLYRWVLVVGEVYGDGYAEGYASANGMEEEARGR